MQVFFFYSFVDWNGQFELLAFRMIISLSPRLVKTTSLILAVLKQVTLGGDKIFTSVLAELIFSFFSLKLQGNKSIV